MPLALKLYMLADSEGPQQRKQQKFDLSRIQNNPCRGMFSPNWENTTSSFTPTDTSVPPHPTSKAVAKERPGSVVYQGK